MDNLLTVPDASASPDLTEAQYEAQIAFYLREIDSLMENMRVSDIRIEQLKHETSLVFDEIETLHQQGEVLKQETRAIITQIQNIK